jgi:lipoprotein-anchoring transpeptidase ErfK/SrfK
MQTMRGALQALSAATLVTVVLAGCSAAPMAEPAGSTTPSSSTQPTSTDPPATATTITLAAATTTSTILTAQTLDEGFSLAAKSDGPLDVFESPGSTEPATTLAASTSLGTVRVVAVVEGPADGWLRVQLPVRPNGSEGWVPESAVELFVVDRRVEVNLGARSLVVTGPDGILLETTVAIGSSTSPTPTGRFFVTDSVILSDAAGPWGPHAFGLSAHSDTVTEFNGGDGIIGIHGTNQPSSIGESASLGCVRVPNEIALELAGLISAGVPVDIVP